MVLVSDHQAREHVCGCGEEEGGGGVVGGGFFSLHRHRVHITVIINVQYRMLEPLCLAPSHRAQVLF